MSEIFRKKFSCLPIAVLLPCHLQGKKMAGSEADVQILGSFSREDATGGPRSFLPGEGHLCDMRTQIIGCNE
jgi:hypothetical protein